MQKFIKRFMAFLLALLFVFGMIFSVVSNKSDFLPQIKADAATSGIFTYELKSGKIKITKCVISAEGVVEIPSVIGKNPVTSIGNSAFNGCINITEIIIPDSVTAIGSYAFEDCVSLQSISIPESVTSIGAFAFESCTSLDNVVIPSSVTAIERYTFGNCTALKNIELNEGLVSVAYDAFVGCSALESIVIPDSVTYLDSYVFQDCTSLTDVKLGNGLKSIGFAAFCRCSSLKEITIPDSVLTINKYCFAECSSLENIDLSKNLQTIDYAAFWRCQNLLDIDIPDSVATIADNAFEDCSALENVKIGRGVTSIGANAFYKCTSINEVNYNAVNATMGDENAPSFNGCIGIKTVNIGDGVQTIPAYAFYNCYLVENITIPNSVTSIGDAAFMNCTGIKEVVLPCSLETVSANTFFNCTGIKEIAVPMTVTSINEGAFYDCYQLKNIYYEGSTDDWSKITIADGNTYLKSAAIYDIHEHSYEVISLVPSTCTKQGETKKVCTICGSQRTEISEISADGHSFGEWTVITDSKCEENGFKYHVCEECGLTEITDIEPKGHNFDDQYTIDKEPTCTTAGSKSRHCLDCEAVTDSVIIDATGHKLININYIAPTCTQPGKNHDKYCENCEKIIETGEYIPELGHSWNEHFFDYEANTIISIQPTCTTSGVSYVKCDRCTERCEYKIIPATGHTEVTDEAVIPTYDSTGLTEGKHCSVCGDILVEQDIIEKIPIPTVYIVNNPGEVTLDYGESIMLIAKAENLPEDAMICWYVNDKKVETRNIFTLTKPEGKTVVTVKIVDKNGDAVSVNGNEVCDTEIINVNDGFFKKIVAFLKTIFGRLMVRIQSAKI